jgi:hypothetical protein
MSAFPEIQTARPRNDQGGRERCYVGISLKTNPIDGETASGDDTTI